MWHTACCMAAITIATVAIGAERPEVGKVVPDFELNDLQGMKHSLAETAKKGPVVLMVYPGPSKGLQEHAAEFVSGKTLPADFHMLIDPDYTFTNAYDLRWEAKNETAYPSTFVIGKDRKVLFSKISKSHGDRAAAEDVLKALP